MTEDRSLSGGLTCTTNVKHSEGFINRRDELTELSRLVSDKVSRFICIWGEAGIGKTWLAREFAYRQARQHQFQAVVWTTAKEKDLTTRSSVLQDALGRPPQIRQQKNPAGRRKELVRSLDELYQAIAIHSNYPTSHGSSGASSCSRDDILKWLRIRKLLIAIDDLDGWSDSWPDVVDFVKAVPFPSVVLITSRYELNARTVPGVAVIEVGRLSNMAAQELIDQTARERGIDLMPAERHAILHFARGNSLMLRLAVGLAPKRERASNELVSILARAMQNPDAQSYLYDRLFKGLTTHAQSVAVALALVNQEGLPEPSEEEIATICDLRRGLVQTAIEELRAASLINGDREDQRRYDMHPMAVDFVMSQLPDLRQRLGERMRQP